MNKQPVALELFPELPPGGKQIRTRQTRVARPEAAPSALVAARPEAPKQGLLHQTADKAEPPAAKATAIETLAARLEAHADYRVQRRLKPRLNWPGKAAGGITRIIVLDTETTGLDQSRELIIELALLRVDIDNATGLPVGAVQVYDGLEDPGKPIPPEVVALTGIQDADVRGHKLDAARVAEMLEGVDLVIAHNAGFDRPFVEKRFAQFAELNWACSFADIDWKAQGQGSAKLESLAQARGWFFDAHRAEMDCHALLAVLAHQLPACGHTGLAELLQAAQRPSYTLLATNAPFEAKDLLKARSYRWNSEQRVWATRLHSEAELTAECAWLKQNVYAQRSATVQVEKQDARARFSSRAGVLSQQPL